MAQIDDQSDNDEAYAELEIAIRSYMSHPTTQTNCRNVKTSIRETADKDKIFRIIVACIDAEEENIFHTIAANNHTNLMVLLAGIINNVHLIDMLMAKNIRRATPLHRAAALNNLDLVSITVAQIPTNRGVHPDSIGLIELLQITNIDGKSVIDLISTDEMFELASLNPTKEEELLDEIKTKKALTQTDIKKLADRNKSGSYIIPTNQAECRSHALEIFLSGGGNSIENNPTELSTDVEKAGLQHRFAQSNAASDYSFVTVKEIVNNIAPTCALLTVWMTTTADTEGTRSHLDSLIGEIMHVIPDFIPVVIMVQSVQSLNPEVSAESIAPTALKVLSRRNTKFHYNVSENLSVERSFLGAMAKSWRDSDGTKEFRIMAGEVSTEFPGGFEMGSLDLFLHPNSALYVTELAKEDSNMTSVVSDKSEEQTAEANDIFSGVFPIGDWRKERTLGEGAHGVVLLYVNVKNKENIAIKQFNSKSCAENGKDTIRNEIEKLCKMSHENIVQYIGSETVPVTLIMEYMPKGSIKDVMKGKPGEPGEPISDSVGSYFTKQIIAGLEFLHSKQIIHRDLKCSNVLLDNQNTVKLSDLGLAKFLKNHSESSCSAQTNTQDVGSMRWRAPEVMQDEKTYGYRADIWSLGVTIYEMLTGAPILSEDSSSTANAKIRVYEDKHFKDFVPNGKVTEKAKSLMRRVLVRDPSERPKAVTLKEDPWIAAKGKPHMLSTPESSGQAIQDQFKMVANGNYQENAFWEKGDSLGKGTDGTVYLYTCKQNGVKKHIAVKRFAEHYGDYHVEIDILSGLSHKNIVQYVGRSKPGEQLALCMEYIAGGTLRKRIDQSPEKKFDDETARKYAAQIHAGLIFLHGQSFHGEYVVVHRDLHAGNVLFDAPNDRMKLTDFGLSKRLQVVNDISKQGNSAEIGHDSYRAPEVFSSNHIAEYGRKADVWSFGVLIVEMLTGKHYLYSKHAFERVNKPFMASYTYQNDFNNLSYVTENIEGRALDLLRKIFVEKDIRPYAHDIALLDDPWLKASE